MYTKTSRSPNREHNSSTRRETLEMYRYYNTHMRLRSVEGNHAEHPTLPLQLFFTEAADIARQNMFACGSTSIETMNTFNCPYNI